MTKEELLKAIETCTGPDERIDVESMIALGFKLENPASKYGDEIDVLPSWMKGDLVLLIEQGYVSDSIDAVDQLTRKLLPKHEVMTHGCQPAGFHRAKLWPNALDIQVKSEGSAETEPRARLAALVRAVMP